MDPIKLNAAINIAFGIINSGVEIYQTLTKDGVTEEELLGIIDRENKEQEAAKQKLRDLLSAN